MRYEYVLTASAPAHTLHRVYNSLASQTFRDF